MWNALTGDKLLTYERLPDRFELLSVGMAYPLAWSPSGEFIVSASDDQPLQAWDAQAGATYMTFVGHEKGVTCVDWSSDSLQIASGSDDRTVHIWDIKTGRQLLLYEKHKNGLSALFWSPDGVYLASSSEDETVRIWKVF